MAEISGAPPVVPESLARRAPTVNRGFDYLATGPAFTDFLIGSLQAAAGRKMRFTGTTVLRVENGKIAEEIGLDDGVTALQQLGILKAA